MNDFLTHEEVQKLNNKILTKAIDNMTTNMPIGDFMKVSLEDGEIRRTVIPLTDVYREE